MITDAKTDSSTLVSSGSLSPTFDCTTNCGIKISIPALKGKIKMIKFFATHYITGNIIIDMDGLVIFQNRSYSARELKIIEDLPESKLMNY